MESFTNYIVLICVLYKGQVILIRKKNDRKQQNSPFYSYIPLTLSRLSLDENPALSGTSMAFENF